MVESSEILADRHRLERTAAKYVIRMMVKGSPATIAALKVAEAASGLPEPVILRAVVNHYRWKLKRADVLNRLLCAGITIPGEAQPEEPNRQAAE